MMCKPMFGSWLGPSFCLALALFILAACGGEGAESLPTPSPAPQLPAEARPQRPPDLPAARVQEALDPATFRLEDGRVLRLVGVLAPGPDQAVYAAAMAFVGGLVLNRDLGLELGAMPSDEQGRLWFYLWADGLLVNYELLRGGYGYFSDESGLSQHDGFLRQAQTYAQAEGAGLWQKAPPGLSILSLEAETNLPATQTLGDEVLLLVNQGETTLDLEGYQVSDADNNRYTFPPGANLAPSLRLSLYVGCGQDDAVRYYWCASGPIWDNNDDRILLSNPQGQVIDQRELGRP